MGTAATDFEIIDLPERHEQAYFLCLEEWSDEMRESSDLKARWYERTLEKGLRVKLAVDEHDRPIGMIHYVPIEISDAEGAGLYMILCIWVHGYRAGVGKQQGHGVRSALLHAAEEDARSLGASGMTAWGLRAPVWMRASWFKKHGYRRADRTGMRELVWKPFTDDAVAPRWIAEQPAPAGEPGKVTLTAFSSGWCPAANLVYERARTVAEEVGPAVSFVSIDTSDRASKRRHGRSDQVLLDGRPLQRGAPPSLASIRRRVLRAVRRKQRRQAS